MKLDTLTQICGSELVERTLCTYQWHCNSLYEADANRLCI